MASPKDYEVHVYLNEYTYKQFIELTELKGMSQSGLVRSLIVEAIAKSRDEFYQHKMLQKQG